MGYIYISRTKGTRRKNRRKSPSRGIHFSENIYVQRSCIDPEIVPLLCPPPRNLVHIRRPTEKRRKVCSTMLRFEPFHDRFRAHLDRHHATLSTIELTRNNISRPLLTVPASLSEATSFIKLNNGFPLPGWMGYHPSFSFPSSAQNHHQNTPLAANVSRSSNRTESRMMKTGEAVILDWREREKREGCRFMKF